MPHPIPRPPADEKTAEMQRIANTLFPMAQEQVRKRGELALMGAVMEADGSVVLVDSPAPPGTETRDALPLLAEKVRRHAEERGIRAAGFCFRVRLTHPRTGKPTEAICADLEHAAGRTLRLLMPFHKRLLGGMEFEPLFGTPGEHRVFTGSAEGGSPFGGPAPESVPAGS
jgi:hypothetical protein